MMKVFRSATLFILLSLCLFGMLPPSQASADPGQPGPYGTTQNYGYFKGQPDFSGGDVWPGGVSDTTVDGFIARVKCTGTV